MTNLQRWILIACAILFSLGVFMIGLQCYQISASGTPATGYKINKITGKTWLLYPMADERGQYELKIK